MFILDLESLMKLLSKSYEDIISFLENQDYLLKKKTLSSLKRKNKDIELFLTEIGNIFKKIRIKKRKTLRDFCKEYKLDAVEISNIERGLILASPQVLASYSKLI